MTIFTVGYEGLNIDTFLALLAEHDIEAVVDIRQLPLSRKPGFSKKALSGILNLSGFEYAPMPNLGCPKPVRDRYRKDSNWKLYTQDFMQYLKGQSDSVVELSSLVKASRCALLCYEADFNFCHRTMVANAVDNHCGANIKHIQASEIKTTSPASLQLAFV